MAESLILDQYLSALVLFILGAITVIAFMLLNRLLAPNRRRRENRLEIEGLSAFIAYECGEVPIGDAQTRFNFQYYVFALVFVIFDVVTSFLIAWGLSLQDVKFNGDIAMVRNSAFAFIGILMVGFIYWWRRNALRWM